jgi:hypothetical protein
MADDQMVAGAIPRDLMKLSARTVLFSPPLCAVGGRDSTNQEQPLKAGLEGRR